MSRLCVICARGGSRGLPGKNLRPLRDKPLVAHSVLQARRCGLFDLVAVSSDSDEILEVAGRWGADQLVRRPAELASAAAPKLPAIRHCAREAEALAGSSFETVVDLDATAPLRSDEDIRGAVELLETSGSPNVVSGAPARRSPYFNIVELDGRGRVQICKPPDARVCRRQDSPPCYDLNAAVYAWTRRQLLEGEDELLVPGTRLYVMPAERSVDIDTEIDFMLVELLMSRREASDDER